MRVRVKGAVFAMGLVAGSIWLSEGLQAEKPEKPVNPAKTFMREKLKDAQKVLEGLATEDFKLIKEGAAHMQVMSRATEWHIVEGPVYAEYSAEFRRCCEQLAKRAEEKNAKAATLSYMQLTLACVNCHEFVRSTRVAQGGRDPFSGPETFLVRAR